MCDILDTISLNRLFQLRLHVQWDPYKGILAKSLNFGPNVRLFRARKCGFSSDPPPLLRLNDQLFCRFDWTAPQIRFLEFILGDIFQSKSHPYKQSSKRPQIIRSIRRVFIKSTLNTIYLWMQLFILTTSQAVTSKTSKIWGRTTLPELELEPWHKCCPSLRLWWNY